MADFRQLLRDTLARSPRFITVTVQHSNGVEEESRTCDEATLRIPTRVVSEDNNVFTNVIKKKRKSPFPLESNKKSSSETTSTSQKCDSQSNESANSNILISGVDAKVDSLGKLQKCIISIKDCSLNPNKPHSMKIRCQSVLSLAVLCTSEDLCEAQMSECMNAFQFLTDSHKNPSLAICHALLLCSLTKKAMSLDKKKVLETSISKLATSVIIDQDENSGSCIGTSRLEVLAEEYIVQAHKLCQKLFPVKFLDLHSIDVSTICCSSLKNLSDPPKLPNRIIGGKYMYTEDTLKYILGMTGKSTQEIVSENLSGESEEHNFVSATSHTVSQCLQVIEYALTVDTNIHRQSLKHEDFSILHCLTRLLGWCMTSLFKKEHCENAITQYPLSSFHLSTLVSILKILSVLSFNPDQYVTFTNVKGLMEMIMICTLKAYFQSEGNHFDVLVLSLELMINLFIKHRKTYALLCLKKFQISNCQELLAIEALLKMLSNSLDKINEVKSRHMVEKPVKTSKDSDKVTEESDMQLVLQAADKDMELSTIVSFVSVLLAFFMDIKQSFLEFIRERLPFEKSTEAIDVSRKFLQFASLTGGMPATGILILRHAIKSLCKLYPSNVSSSPLEQQI